MTIDERKILSATFQPHRSRIYGFATIMHAHKDGGVVLKGEASFFRTVSGMLIAGRFGKILIMFRHRGKW